MSIIDVMRKSLKWTALTMVPLTMACALFVGLGMQAMEDAMVTIGLLPFCLFAAFLFPAIAAVEE